jgi:hypothetical protein
MTVSSSEDRECEWSESVDDTATEAGAGVVRRRLALSTPAPTMATMTTVERRPGRV